MRRFILFLALTICALVWWNDFVSSGKLLRAVDKNPDRPGIPTALFTMARYYELFGKDQQALAYYGKVVEHYSKSSYGMAAHYGLAVSYENVKDYRKALEEFEKFVELYPRSKYTVSTRNKIEILKSR